MTDKEFHSGTEREGWVSNTLGRRRHRRRIRSDDPSFSVCPVPICSVLGQATPTREATTHLEVHSFAL